MKFDLRSHFREYYSKNSPNIISDRKPESSQDLPELLEVRLKEILFAIDSFSINKPNIIIAESQPIDFLAIFLAGIIKDANIFLCDPNWQQQEWQQVLDLVQPDLVYAQQPIKDLVLKTQVINTNKFKLQPDLSQESLIMIPTGGSSGKVKFTMHNWSTLRASVIGFQKYFGYQEINSFCTLPLYHVSGLMQFMRSFLTQGHIIICPYKLIKDEQLEFDIQDYFISLVPTQLQLLINSIPTKLAKFKTVLLGGASISRSLLDKAREHNISLAPTYGMTETASGIVTLKPEDFLAGNNSSGQVLPHAEVIVESAANNSGLIELKSDSLCLGYYPHVFDRSYLFSTDDIGYFDHEGYLYLVGRNSQKIVTGGENVFPAEVESAILATKLVKDVCVVGMRDIKWGQAVTAIYVPLQSKQDANLIQQKVRLQLAKYKQPKNWIEVDSLPRNNRGKINLEKVKAIAKQVIGNKYFIYMNIWQVDFYYLPDQPGEKKLWELTICDYLSAREDQKTHKVYSVQCYPEQANAQWLIEQIKRIAKDKLPDKIQVFRPQALGIINTAAEQLNIEVEATRNTTTLKNVLIQKYQDKYPDYNPIKLDKPVPQALPEDLWGDKWQIANIKADQIVDLFRDRPIPICYLPEPLYPINLGVSSDLFIPGIVVYGGRKSMQIAQWIRQKNPAFINYIPTEIGKSGGFILETGLVDRWIFNTFESEEAAKIARNYEQKKQAAQGLHFILIQPDDSGMTNTAFWLLRQDIS